jgi:hypothetical protein
MSICVIGDDILSHIKSFVCEDYLYFALVSNKWKSAWGEDVHNTRAVSEFTSLSQVLFIADMYTEKNDGNRIFVYLNKIDIAFGIYICSNIVYILTRFQSWRKSLNNESDMDIKFKKCV